MLFSPCNCVIQNPNQTQHTKYVYITWCILSFNVLDRHTYNEVDLIAVRWENVEWLQLAY
jgi:hypothetical protein